MEPYTQARIVTASLESVILVLVAFTYYKAKAVNPDLLRAMVVLRWKEAVRYVYVLVVGFIFVSMLSYAALAGLPVDGLYQMPFLVAWLILTLYATYGFFRIVSTDKSSTLLKSGTKR